MSNKKTINTVIVLRNDSSTAWADSSAVLQKGEVGISYLDNGNVVVKAGDGTSTWGALRQVEGVFEQPVTLTQDFGYFDVPTGGSKTFDGSDGGINTQGMTTTEFLMAALKKAVNPTVTQPNAYFSSVKVANTGANLEVGSYVTSISWDGTTSNGTYKVGSSSDQGTGISSGDFTWNVSNDVDSQTSTKIDGSFDITANKKQIQSTSEVTYATVTATVTLDPSKAKNPKNNLGEDVASLKITGYDTAGTKTKTFTGDAKATGFHKCFWAVKTAAADLKKPTAYTSSDVRALANSANSTKGFPTSLTVPVGSEQVMFFARAGAYSSLEATDDKAMNAGVTFTKKANAVKVKGNNEYAPEGTDGFDYDLWYVDWNADSNPAYTGTGALQQLTLKWS